MIDPTERSLWSHLGDMAYSLKNLRLSRLAFENGFFSTLSQESQSSQSIFKTYSKGTLLETQIFLNDGNISPIQWKCLNGLCQVLYDIGDYQLCEFYLKIGLQRFPNWELGLKLNNQIKSTDESIPFTILNNSNNSNNISFAHIPLTIKEPSWESLLKGLIKQYKLQYNITESKQKNHSSNKNSNDIVDDLVDGNDNNIIFNKPIQIQMEIKLEISEDDSANENRNDTINSNNRTSSSSTDYNNNSNNNDNRKVDSAGENIDKNMDVNKLTDIEKPLENDQSLPAESNNINNNMDTSNENETKEVDINKSEDTENSLKNNQPISTKPDNNNKKLDTTEENNAEKMDIDKLEDTKKSSENENNEKKMDLDTSEDTEKSLGNDQPLSIESNNNSKLDADEENEIKKMDVDEPDDAEKSSENNQLIPIVSDNNRNKVDVDGSNDTEKSSENENKVNNMNIDTPDNIHKTLENENNEIVKTSHNCDINQLNKDKAIVTGDDTSKNDINNEKDENKNHSINLKRKHDKISRNNDESEDKDNSNSADENGDEEDDGDEDDDDDDDGREVKRVSLRAAKKQKEKEFSKEASKQKMLEEEEGLCNKIQDIFDMLKDKSEFNRPNKWYLPKNSDYNINIIYDFWEYFDTKLLELGANYSWTFDNSKLKDDLLLNNSNKKHRYLQFQANKLVSSVPLNDELISQFIESLNQTNSGISDSLVRTITYILLHGSDLGDLSVESYDLLLESVELLGQNSLEYLLNENHQEMINNNNDIKGLVRLCELFVDHYITSIKNEQQSPIINLSTKGKVSKEKRMKILQKEYQYYILWIEYLERFYIINSILSFDPSSSNSVPHEQKIIILRYWLLKGKLAQCNDNIDGAYDWYRKCESLLDGDDDMKQIEINLHCQYDSIVSLSAIRSKLKQLGTGKRLIDAQLNYSNHKYQEVLEEIEDLVQYQLNMDNIPDSTDFYKMVSMVAKSYVKTNRYLDAWKCYIKMLTTFFSEFISYGANKKKTNSIPQRDSDTDFFRLLKLIDLVMQELVSLLSDTKCEDWFPNEIDIKFTDSLMIFLRTTIFYIFRHPDYIPLVNNFTIPDVPPHRPSERTKENFYNALTTKSWLLLSILIQLNSNNDKQKITLLSELLQNMHDELGEREICRTSNGMFLRYIMKILTINDESDENRGGIYQCYHCLYGVHLTADGELLEEHHALHSEIDLPATEHLYKIVIDGILKKLNRNAQLKNDLKDVVDVVSDVVNDLPTNNRYVDHNKKIIEAYLNSPIDITVSLKSMLKKCNLPFVKLKNKSPSISVIYDHIFWIRGKMLRTNIRNRPKGSSEKTMSDLEEAVEQLKCHVILHPDNQHGWFELALTLMHLSEEELTWSASNIKTHKNEIMSYQQQSFHSFMQVWYLSTLGKSIDKNQLFGYFTNFGLLIYSMTCAPMKMAAFQMNRKVFTLNASGKLNEEIKKKVKPSVAFQLTIHILSKALAFKSTENIRWKTLYTIGLCYNNLNRPPKEVLDWFLKSIQQCQKEQASSNDLECTYKFCSYLVKYLYNDSITPEEATNYFNQLPSSTSKQSSNPQPATNYLYPAAEHSDAMTGVIDLTLNDNTTSNEADHNQSAISSNTKNEKMKVFNILFDKLITIRKSDKKNIQHRLVYKIAWMYYHVYNNPEQAKSEILQLFTLKQTNKGLISVWKTDIERPGKIFVFVHQYVTLLIELAKKTDDIDVLKHLCRKLKRANSILLSEEEDFKLALAVYIDITQNRLLANHTGFDKVDEIISRSIDKTKVDKLIYSYIKQAQLEFNGKLPELIPLLHDLLDLRKISVGFVPVTTLDDVIKECFCCILYEYVNIESILNNNTDDSDKNHTDDDANNNQSLSSSSSNSPLRIGPQTLIVQAKTMINSIYGNQK
ncbi:unnamed protein product [Cunninghamella blakesleeana]